MVRPMLTVAEIHKVSCEVFHCERSEQAAPRPAVPTGRSRRQGGRHFAVAPLLEHRSFDDEGRAEGHGPR